MERPVAALKNVSARRLTFVNWSRELGSLPDCVWFATDGSRRRAYTKFACWPLAWRGCVERSNQRVSGLSKHANRVVLVVSVFLLKIGVALPVFR